MSKSDMWYFYGKNLSPCILHFDNPLLTLFLSNYVLYAVAFD